MEIKFNYIIYYGSGESSETMEHSEELSLDEEIAFKRCKRFGIDYEKSDLYDDVYNRAKNNILQKEVESAKKMYGDDADTNFKIQVYLNEEVTDVDSIDYDEIVENISELFEYSEGDYHDVNEYITYLRYNENYDFTMADVYDAAEEYDINDYEYEKVISEDLTYSNLDAAICDSYVEVAYYVPSEYSEVYYFDVGATEEEIKLYNRAKRLRESFVEMPELESFVNRAYDEISEQEARNYKELYDEYVDVDVTLCDFEDDGEPDDGEMEETIQDLLKTADGNFDELDEYIDFLCNEYGLDESIEIAENIAEKLGIEYKYEE